METNMDNKKKYHLRASIALFSLTALTGNYAQAKAPTDSELVDITLLTHLAQGEPLGLPINMAADSDSILQLAKDQPHQWRNAAVLFEHGLSASQLARFAEENGLNLVDLEAKVVTQNDEVMTIWIRDLLAYEGTASEKLTFFENRHRKVVRNSHKEKLSMTAGHDSAQRRKINQSMAQLLKLPLKFYKVGVLQTHQELAQLMNMDKVAALGLPRDKSSSLSALLAQPLLPLKTLGRNVTKTFAPKRIEPSALTQGESTLMLSPLSSLTPTVCGPGVPNENNCPPDINWLPSPKKISGSANSSYSFIYNHTIGSSNDPYNPLLKWSQGNFHSTIKWSGAVANGVVTNTAAFKADQLKHCNPDIDFSDLDAECAVQLDNIYVPEATYEDEGAIDNPACLTPRSPDTNYNRVNGCWEPSYASSSLPYAYLDTTLSDGPSEYSATIGTYRPDLLSEGTTYTNYTEFWAYEHNNMLGKKYIHRGQIGSRFGIYSPFSVFSVDTSRLTDELFYIPIN
jgi:hypothetical protein